MTNLIIFAQHRYYYVDQMEDEMGGACCMMRNWYKIFAGEPEGKRPLVVLGVDGRIILKWVWTGFGWLRLWISNRLF
jgi:hypothetical protein